jgi:hypothetical protein
MGGFIDGLISRIVYIASLRLGGRKLPTYELMLRLLGVATMYGWMGGCLLMVTVMVSSTVMYNFGGGPRGDPMNLAF